MPDRETRSLSLRQIESLQTAPVRQCRTVHDCALCQEDILCGQLYHDRGYGRRVHVACLKDAVERPTSDPASKQTPWKSWLEEGGKKVVWRFRDGEPTAIWKRDLEPE